VGASSRVKQPDWPMGEHVVFAPLGHVAFVVTKVPNVLGVTAGTRSMMRVAAISDSKFLQWVVEMRRLLPKSPSDALPHTGLVLVDVGDPARGLPQFWGLAQPAPTRQGRGAISFSSGLVLIVSCARSVSVFTALRRQSQVRHDRAAGIQYL